MRAAETWRVFATLGGMSTVAAALFVWHVLCETIHHDD